MDSSYLSVLKHELNINMSQVGLLLIVPTLEYAY